MAGYRITLRIEGADEASTNVRLGDFLQQISALRNALRKTAELVIHDADRIEWRVVDLSHSSPATIVIEAVDSAAGEPDAPALPMGADPREATVSRFFGIMNSLSVTGVAQPDLDRATLVAFKELAAPVRHERVRTSIWNGSQGLEVVGSVETVIDALLAPRIRETGSVEGRLEFMNIHGGKHLFRIYPVVGPDRVECRFPEESLDKARTAIGRTVRVSGEVTYLIRDSFPHSIVVHDIEVLPDDSDLPSLSDLRGMAPNATGNLSSEDFVRELRAEE